jgi:pimeloyl-ACP methyl ester carboxylesterase
MPFIQIQWRSRDVLIDYEWVGVADESKPILVFLHEGLGSIAMWKEYPHQLATLLGMRGLVYSRPAYGKSSPRLSSDHWGVDFLHQQALEVFPNLIQELQIHQPVILLGHSDGASIALLIAANHSELVSGAIVIAPHIFVEEITIQSIEQARVSYETGFLKQALFKYHDDVDSAFWGWNNIWLKPEFKEWNITQDLQHIKCPLLAIQGTNDPYGTMAQVKELADYMAEVDVVEIPDCGHSPHRDQPEKLTQAIKVFVEKHRRNSWI